MADYVNLTDIRAVAMALENLEEKAVFVGGATVQLYASGYAATESRPTQDIDVVIALVSYSDSTELDRKLVNLGFKNDVMSGVICRYIYQDIVVDVMPTESSSLGFSNRWYAEGINQAILYPIDSESSIYIFTAPYFLASKLEAFKSYRHGKDFRMNSDFEDIIYVFDNRIEIENEIRNSPVSVRKYLAKELKNLLNHPDIQEGISVHLEYSTSGQRTQRILTIWDNFIKTVW
ncbi:hypothetical protein [Larkinella terrae]|nr:hypothetical protein [Larkinella terrae]